MTRIELKNTDGESIFWWFRLKVGISTPMRIRFIIPPDNKSVSTSFRDLDLFPDRSGKIRLVLLSK